MLKADYRKELFLFRQECRNSGYAADVRKGVIFRRSLAQIVAQLVGKLSRLYACVRVVRVGGKREVVDAENALYGVCDVYRTVRRRPRWLHP